MFLPPRASQSSCFIVPAVAVWLGIESLDRSPRPSEWYS